MKLIIENTQSRLAAVALLKHIDEDWGQLDDYSPNFPVKWPVALIELRNVLYTNIGRERGFAPENRQMATATVVIHLATLKLSNTSGLAPQGQKDDARQIWEIIEQVHALLQGYKPVAYSGGLMRTQLSRRKRDDGITQYEMTYTLGLHNV